MENRNKTKQGMPVIGTLSSFGVILIAVSASQPNGLLKNLMLIFGIIIIFLAAISLGIRIKKIRSK
jgi:hypothetical protein